MNLGQAFCKAPIFGLFFGSPVFPVESHQASTTTHLVNLKPWHSVSSTPGFPHKMLALTSPGKCTGGFTPDCIHQISIMNVPCCCNMLQVLVHRWGEGERPPVDLVAASIIFTGSWWSADSTRAEQWGAGQIEKFWRVLLLKCVYFFTFKIEQKSTLQSNSDCIHNHKFTKMFLRLLYLCGDMSIQCECWANFKGLFGKSQNWEPSYSPANQCPTYWPNVSV